MSRRADYMYGAGLRPGPDGHVIVDSRQDDNFTIHLTYAAKEGDLRHAAAGVRAGAAGQGPGAFGLRTRPDTDRSLRIDLGDPPFST